MRGLLRKKVNEDTIKAGKKDRYDLVQKEEVR